MLLVLLQIVAVLLFYRRPSVRLSYHDRDECAVVASMIGDLYTSLKTKQEVPLSSRLYFLAEEYADSENLYGGNAGEAEVCDDTLLARREKRLHQLLVAALWRAGRVQGFRLPVSLGYQSWKIDRVRNQEELLLTAAAQVSQDFVQLGGTLTAAKPQAVQS
ncbi:MAG TPA: hypothetical protein VGE59_00345 [Patescibacteria group bacterium]